MTTPESLEPLSRLLEEGADRDVEAFTRDALGRGVAPPDLLDALLAGMAVVGRRFKAHEIFLPDVLLSARAMHAAMRLLKPLLVATGVPTRGTVVIGTVRGDLHDIGKNLVGIMLQGAGFDVVDLGNDVPAERFVDAALERGASVIAMSALLTTTMVHMRDVVELLAERGLRDRIRTIIGGAPVTAEYAREIGADAYAFDATSAADRIGALAGTA
jgi:5-methyltetrahydrofolate--homocysteine methyltransferase